MELLGEEGDDEDFGHEEEEEDKLLKVIPLSGQRIS